MLTISFPDEIDKQLSSITYHKKEFIIAAVRQRIANQKNQFRKINWPKSMRIVSKKMIKL